MVAKYLLCCVCVYANEPIDERANLNSSTKIAGRSEGVKKSIHIHEMSQVFQ